MTIVVNRERPTEHLWGIAHQTLAGQADDLRHLEVCTETIEPGGELPLHYHRCEEVLVLLEGRLNVMFNTWERGELEAGSTLIVPAGMPHALRNPALEPARMILAFSATPARAYDLEGNEIDLPWHRSADPGRTKAGARGVGDAYNSDL